MLFNTPLRILCRLKKKQKTNLKARFLNKLNVLFEQRTLGGFCLQNTTVNSRTGKAIDSNPKTQTYCTAFS